MSPRGHGLGRIPERGRPSIEEVIVEVSDFVEGLTLACQGPCLGEGRLEILPNCGGTSRDHFTLGIDFTGHRVGGATRE